MKVMFIYPGFENIGIEYLSAVLKKDGFETKLAFDPQMFNDPFLRIKYLDDIFNYKEVILNEIKEYKPQLIAFSVISANYRWALTLASGIRDFSSAHITFGGIHPSSVPGKVIDKNCVDSVVVGEGEYALLELAQSIRSGNIDHSIKNIWFKQGNGIIKNPIRGYIEELDSLPFPDKELYYREIPYYKNGYTIITRRGCINSCNYCHNSVKDRIYPDCKGKMRFRSVENVIEELAKAKVKYNFKLLRVNDDLFTYNKNWLRKFSEIYKKEINVPLYCFGSPTTVDKETVHYLKKVGCYQLCLGVQSINPTVRKNIFNRRGSNSQIINAIRLCRENNIRVVVDNIIGYPGQKKEEMLEMAKFYSKYRPHRICVFWLVYYPKLPIIRLAKEKGILGEEDIKKLEENPVDTANTLYNPCHSRKQKKYHLFLVLYHILPVSVYKWMIKHEFYNYLPVINPALIEYPYTIFAKDRLDIPRRRYYVRYLIYIPKIILRKIKDLIINEE